MKLISKILLLLLPIVAGCSKNSNNTTPNMDVQQNKVYFTTTSSGMSYLYSFDPTTNETKLEPAALGKNIGITGFQSRDSNGNLQNLYMVEDIDGQPSRVTLYSTAGNTNQNTTNLPENITDIMLLNNSLYYIGLNRKEIAVSDTTLSSVTLPKTSVQGFSELAKPDSESFQAILNNENDTYVISVGNYPYSPLEPVSIFKLNSSLTHRSTDVPNSWVIQGNDAQGNNIICDRINSNLSLTNSKQVVACNSSESFPKSTYTPSLFLIDISGANPVVTLLQTTTKNMNITLGGTTHDKSSIFVTEEIDGGDYYNPNVSQSYWLNVSNANSPIKTPNNSGAYYVSYNNAINEYIFSCVLNSSNQCQNNTFGVAQSSSRNNEVIQSQVKPVPLTGLTNLNGVRGINFFNEL